MQVSVVGEKEPNNVCHWMAHIIRFEIVMYSAIGQKNEQGEMSL